MFWKKEVHHIKLDNYLRFIETAIKTVRKLSDDLWMVIHIYPSDIHGRKQVKPEYITFKYTIGAGDLIGSWRKYIKEKFDEHMAKGTGCSYESFDSKDDGFVSYTTVPCGLFLDYETYPKSFDYIRILRAFYAHTNNKEIHTLHLTDSRNWKDGFVVGVQKKRDHYL